MSFWKSGTGKDITGNSSDAFLRDFTVIPDGTVAQANILSFCLIEKEFQGEKQKMFEVIYKLKDGDFKNREVSQKIKVFSGKPESIDRNLNMLKLIMNLCNFNVSHDGVPSDQELAQMNGRVVSIKIREFSSPGKDGRVFETNFVSEVYAAGSVATETGEKAIVTHKPTQSDSKVESAFSRNEQSGLDVNDDDIPF